MTPDDSAPRAERARPFVRYSATVARAICTRVAAGETLLAICADPAMPSRSSVKRWARERPAFGRIYNRAKALGNRVVDGRPSTWCPVTAHEIAVRVSEGESLTAIADDPAMPSLGTIFYWRKQRPEFAEALHSAREALAERMSDLGWRMAMEATPETAYLTRVRLAQLRWTAAIRSPRTHGRLKAAEPAAPPEVDIYLIRHFRVEEHPETGQHRVVSYTPDPDTMRPVRSREGPWTDPVDPKLAALEGPSAQREAPPPHDPIDPEGL